MVYDTEFLLEGDFGYAEILAERHRDVREVD